MGEDSAVTYSPGPGVIRATSAQVTAIVNAASASGRIPPWRREYYRHRIMAGGRTAGEAVAVLMQLHPAPPDVAASWDRDPRAASSGPAHPADPLTDAEYRLLYPDAELAAAELERQAELQDRTRVRPPAYDNKMRAAAQEPGHHGSVPGHGPASVQHSHGHAAYDGSGGRHDHPHIHREDANHGPGAGHDHGPAVGDPVASGIAARRRDPRSNPAAAVVTDPQADEDLYRVLFGD